MVCNYSFGQVNDDFESGAAGWSNQGAPASGNWTIGNPTGTNWQLEDDHTPSGVTALYTAANNGGADGTDDVDGGTAILQSPIYNITVSSTLSVWYFFGQRDNGDDAGDFFRLEYSLDGGTSYTTLVFIGDVTTIPNWTNATAPIPAGSNVVLRVSAADGGNAGDIIEAGIDDLSILPSIPIITVGDETVNEDDGTVTFTVRHTGASATGPFTVNYTTSDDTATSGTDYTTTNGILNFSGTVNDTETITVPILDDALFENTEIFNLQFTATSDPGVDISDSAIGTIADDDAIVMTDGVTENTCDDTFVDSGIGSNYGNNENIVYTICPDTANNYISLDFRNFDVRVGDLLSIYRGTTTGGTLIGQFDNSNVPTNVDSSVAEGGCLTLQFTSNGNTTGTGWEARVTCSPEGPKIIIDDISFDEDIGNAVFTVRSTRAAHGINTLFGFVNRPFTVDFQTVNGSALAGSDYTTTTGTLTFTGAIGNVQTISVPISNDGIPEFDEDFWIEFTGANAPNGTINFSDTGRGTINSQILANDPLTLFQEFDGYFDYTTTGGTLRTNSNGVDACSITTTSSNNLISPIPATATIEKAYLYWAHSNTVRDASVTFEGQTVTANFLYQTTLTNRNFYGYVSDVTGIVSGISNLSTNSFDFSDLDIDNTGDYCSTNTVLGGWTLIVFYEDPSLPAVNINLYQGFDGLSNEGTSFTLDSFYAISGAGAKASFLSWEGDPDLDGNSTGSTNPEELSITNQGGTNFILSGDGGQTGNNSYNSTIYDNTVVPAYNISTSYGVDLDTYDISTYIQPADTEITANVDVGQDFVISAAVVLKVPSNLIAGTVFEDTNYPGGPGRNLATSGGFGVSGAVVELFNSLGTFVERKTTDINGDYSFGGMADGAYSVKVVNSTIKSNRGGGLNCSVCYPVQTFRRFGTANALTDVTDEVGGADPSASQDVALGVLNGAQSVSIVSVSGNGVVDVNFGFNFNTIVNTNEDGQGSLDQFIVNSNNLDETGLDIEANSIFDPAAGDDTSVFMIPSTADPLGRTPDGNFSNGYFNIELSNGNPLTPITGNNTAIDGRTQTSYSGNTNTGTVGAGGTAVGTSGTVLPNYDYPEIQVYRPGGDVLRLQGTDVVIRNLAVYANNNAGVRMDNGSASVSNNLLGVNALGAAVGGIDDGAEILGGSIIVDSNYISDNTDAGIMVNGGTSSIIQNNHIVLNGNNACDDNITLQAGSGIIIQHNLIENAASLGIDGDGISGNVTITENTIRQSGQDGGNCGGTIENAGILLDGNDSSITNNIINSNGGAGIVLAGGSTAGNLISRNSIYANGTAAATLGIDLDQSNGLGDGVTLNDDGDVDNGPNGAINFPVITSSLVSGSTMVVRGWSRPGATIEFFLTDINEGSATTGDNQLGLSTDYGEGQTFFGTVVEGSASDLDGSSSTYTDLDGNTDTTNKFHFVISLPPTVTVGDVITSTATLSNSTSEFSPMSILRIPTVITNRRITYRVKKD
ncbi:sodium:calcium exchanger [Aggregatimonas sangjinii]|uniref:Sodium:calcium exchanger n=2 Tax=Aggregatimonas sangjinii TaxID=2583587 RepID=A0A5B7SUR4_9FLAO|nr:sodium:calcium exchanger [Aggregatimonas sangjinii]